MTGVPFFTKFKSFFIFFNLFALEPFSLNRKAQYFLTIHSFIQVPIIVCVLITLSNLQRTNESVLSTFVAYLFIIAIITAHFINSIQVFCTRRKHFEMLDIISAVDSIIWQKFGYSHRYDAEVRSIWIKLIAVLFGVVALETIVLFFLFKVQPEENLWWPYYYPFIYIKFRCLQIIFYAVLLRNRLDVINDKIDGFFADGCMQTKSTNHEIISFDNDNSIDNAMKYNRFLTLKCVYGKLYDVSKLLNETFGWSLLVIYTKIFIGLTSSGYWLFVSLDFTNINLDVVIFYTVTVIRLIVVATAIT